MEVNSITITSLEGEKRIISIAAAKQSESLKELIENMEGPYPTHVSTNILDIIIEYLNDTTDTLPVKDVESLKENGIEDKYFKYVDHNSAVLIELIQAANLMAIPFLVELIAKRIADMFMQATVEEFRKEHNIVNDFTPEEMEKVLEENKQFISN